MTLVVVIGIGVGLGLLWDIAKQLDAIDTMIRNHLLSDARCESSVDNPEKSV